MEINKDSKFMIYSSHYVQIVKRSLYIFIRTKDMMFTVQCVVIKVSLRKTMKRK